MILAFGGAIRGSAPRERQGELEARILGMHLPRGCAFGRPRYLQWMKSGTGLCWLNEAASRFMQISTLSPAMIRTAALFSSSKICRCREAHRSSMKSSGKTDTGTETPAPPLHLGMRGGVPTGYQWLLICYLSYVLRVHFLLDSNLPRPPRGHRRDHRRSGASGGESLDAVCSSVSESNRR